MFVNETELVDKLVFDLQTEVKTKSHEMQYPLSLIHI